MSLSSTPASSDGSCVVQGPGTYIASGISGDIYQIDSKHAVKQPKFFPGQEEYNRSFRQTIDHERRVFERLEKHEGIIEFFGIYDKSTGALKLEYANEGDLADYIRLHPRPSKSDRAAMIRSLFAAFSYIYSRKVSLQDIKAENVLVSHGTLKFGDFGEAILHDLNVTIEEVYAQKAFRLDLLGMGCIIYSVSAWEVFDYSYFERGSWPTEEDLPDTHHLMFKEVIEKCWYGAYKNIEDLERGILIA